jgi:capsular polysaccharide biosynthesis protein
MDLAEVFRTLRRQWIVTLLLLLLTVFAVYEASVKFSGPYQAESVIALIPSQKASEPNGRNPFLSFDSSINVAGDVVLRQVMDPHTVANLAARGDASSYEIVDDPNTSAPILDVTATGSNKAQVESTLRVVTRTFQNRLDALQESLKPQNRVTSMVIFMDPVAKLEVSKKARVLVVFLVIGLVFTFAIPLMVDAEMTRIRGRRGSRRPAQGTRGGGWRLPNDRSARARPSASAPAPAEPAQRVLTYGAKSKQAAEQSSAQPVPESARPGGDPLTDEAAWPYRNWPAAPAAQEPAPAEQDKAPGTSTPPGNGGPAGSGGPAGDVQAEPPGSSLPVWR